MKKIGKIFGGLLLAGALSFGAYKGADAVAPKPPLTQVFNTAAAQQGQAAREYRLQSLKAPDAADVKSLWRVRVGAWEIGLSGYHTFLEFSPCDESGGGKDIYQIHGIACDQVRHTWARLNFDSYDSYKQYADGDYVLKGMGVIQDRHRAFFRERPEAYVDVFYGSKEEVLKMYLDGMSIVEGLNKTASPYILLGHNSNCVQYTVLKALGLQEPPLFVPHKLEALGGRIWTPGLNQDLLSGGWDQKKIEQQGGYAKLTGQRLEAQARKVSGSERMFASLKPPQPKKPKL